MFYWHNADFEFYEKPVPTPKPFATATDAELAELLDAYYNDLLSWQDLGWSVGDTRKIKLSSMQAPNPNSGITLPAQDITVVIVDHDHTDLATPINGHSKACITVQTREVLNNYTNSDSDGVKGIYVNGDSSLDTYFSRWSNLYMRTYLNSVVWGAFPTDFKSAIKPSSHYRHTTYNSSGSAQVTDNLFLPSYAEIFGTESYSNYVPTNPVEGTQFEYYQTSSNRIKYGNDINNGASNGTTVMWWNGSPSSSYNEIYYYRWCSVKSSGDARHDHGNTPCGLAPAFAM